MSTAAYQKLPGRSRTWTGASRIWLADDHLLLVQSTGYAETYRRFFLKDIQAITYRPNQVGRIWTAIFAGLWIFLALLALAASDPVGSPILLGLGLPFAAALVIHLIRGRTCSFYIRTAVANERVPALGRVKAAEQFLEQVEPLILAAQGQVAPESLAADLAWFQAGQWPRPVAPNEPAV